MSKLVRILIFIIKIFKLTMVYTQNLSYEKLFDDIRLTLIDSDINPSVPWLGGHKVRVPNMKVMSRRLGCNYRMGWRD